MHILVATVNDNELFYLTSQFSRQELLVLKSSMQFFCPGCEAALTLKIGEIKIPHFAHKSLVDCDPTSERESPIHLQGKLLLYQFFKSKNLPVRLETYLPDIRQRADILINNHTAIEFQCSSLSPGQIASRSSGYRQTGMQPLWIAGPDESIKENIQIVKIPAWKQHLFQQKHGSRFIMAFSPRENRFCYYSGLFFVSGSQWIGKVKFLPAEKQSFPFAIPKRLSKKEFEKVCSLFFQMRKQFIASQLLAKNRMQNAFWRSCYELALDMKNLPGWIGIPMADAYLIRSHAAVWQLQAIEANQKGISFSYLIESGKIPLNASGTPKEAEALLELYMELKLRLMEMGEGNADSGNLLYEYYCKTL